MSEPERLRCAVTAAETGAQWWATAVRVQAGAPSESVDHADLYGLAGELVTTLRTLEELARTFARQASGYGESRMLRDDTGADPMDRLEDAGAAAHHASDVLAVATQHANTFWSAMGHIAVELPPETATDAGAGTDREGGRS